MQYVILGQGNDLASLQASASSMEQAAEKLPEGTPLELVLQFSSNVPEWVLKGFTSIINFGNDVVPGLTKWIAEKYSGMTLETWPNHNLAEYDINQHTITLRWLKGFAFVMPVIEWFVTISAGVVILGAAIAIFQFITGWHLKAFIKYAQSPIGATEIIMGLILVGLIVTQGAKK